MRRYFPDEPLSGRVLIAFVGWPAVGIVLLLLAFLILGAVAPHAPSGVERVLVLLAALGTLVFSYRRARAAGWPASEAAKWGAITLFGMLVMGGALIVIAGLLFPFGEG